MGFDLPVFNRRRRFGSGYIPASLFANAEPGVWYDPSDLTTLFQNSTGSTPVTAPGQPVGLMLDKSQGATLGPELVTNGTFDGSTTGWTLAGGTATVTASESGMTVNASATAFVAQSFATVIGSFYRYSAQITAHSGGVFTGIRKADNSTASVNAVNLRQGIADGVGTSTGFFVATATTTFIVVQANTGGSITADNISAKLLPGNHATQSTSASRPTYQVDSTGRAYLSFDGVDDGMVTPTITPGTDKVQVFAGVRKLSDATIGVIAETSTNSATGSFFLAGPRNAGQAVYGFASTGTVGASATSGVFTAPITSVVTGIGDISGDVATLRVNGVQRATVTTDQGVTNYLAYPLYIGRRGGTTLPFSGNIYSLIVRFGANLTAEQIGATEAWSNAKTGAY
jgi:hypothetical protein